ncbi:MAG: ABC transporter ATP-binding protein [Bacteroidia bacterium]|nr:ABC transporter ATP-binding protein [Bacteroidia bacterium]
MTKGQVVLSANKISKKYLTDNGSKKIPFWALKDISFELNQGQILGIIGQNGAGKSTLLKILSEVIPPTEGTIEYEGSILSILDIGTGFHPDLSGYDNIFLNSAILGAKKKEVLEKIPDIVAFSGIEEFIHEPVKNYSNGMYLRLALSIALYTNNTILLIDEVISSGDVEFRHKAIEKIKELTTQGRSCILISHDLDSIQSLCDKCMLMEKGSIIKSGKPKQIIDEYLDKVNNQLSHQKPAQPLNSKCRFIGLKFEKESFYMDEAIRLKIEFEKYVDEDIDIVLKVKNNSVVVMSDCEIYRSEYADKRLPPGKYETMCEIPANLFNVGNYFVEIIIGDKISSLITLPFAGKFSVQLKEWELNKKWNEENENIPFRPICNWKTNKI